MKEDNVYWMIELNIAPGQSSHMKTLMSEMVAATQANEPGALNYEWNLNDDESMCTIYERYADNNAVMTHIGNFGEFAERFMTVFQPARFTIFGPANDQVKEALAGFRPVYLKSAAGFAR